MRSVVGVIVGKNQFNGYDPPVYEVRPGEKILSAELKRGDGNMLLLYLAVEREE